MELLHHWILEITGASILAAVAKTLVPAGGVHKVTDFICGVMLCSVLLSPLLRLDMDSYASALSEYRHTAWALTGDLEARENELLRPYIEERCRAYILDEARSLGLEELDCALSVKWRDGNWVPYEVKLRGAAAPEQRAALGSILESELGIPAERQRWDAG